MSRVADTSFLYAAFDSGDSRHRDALREIAEPQRLEVPFATLVEFLDLVSYRRGHEAALKVQKTLAGLATLDVANQQDEGPILDLWSEDGKLSMADAVGIQAALRGAKTLLTYDAHQLAVWKRLRR